MQLITLQKQLKREKEVLDSQARLERLNEARGEKSHKQGGAGLKNTWKKLKGKKKKQRNLTAPEIRLGQPSDGGSPLTPLKEGESDEGTLAGSGSMGNKSVSDEKINSLSSVKKQDPKDSPSKIGKSSPRGIRRWSLGQKERERSRTDSPSSAEDASLSQRSESRFSDEQDQSQSVLKTSTTDQSVFDHSDLSQTSKLSLSQPGTFLTNEEPLSTQSSSEVNIQLSPIHPTDRHNGEDVPTGFLPNGHLEEGREGERSETSQENHERSSSSRRSFRLYNDFGDETHRRSLQKVKQLLESSGETEPVDLNDLREWDGWTLASREIV